MPTRLLVSRAPTRGRACKTRKPPAQPHRGRAECGTTLPSRRPFSLRPPHSYHSHAPAPAAAVPGCECHRTYLGEDEAVATQRGNHADLHLAIGAGPDGNTPRHHARLPVVPLLMSPRPRHKRMRLGRVVGRALSRHREPSSEQRQRRRQACWRDRAVLSPGGLPARKVAQRGPSSSASSPAQRSESDDACTAVARTVCSTYIRCTYPLYLLAATTLADGGREDDPTMRYTLLIDSAQGAMAASGGAADPVPPRPADCTYVHSSSEDS